MSWMMIVDELSAYIDSLNVAAYLAAAQPSAEVEFICDLTKVSVTVTSQASGFSLSHRINVAPYGCFPSCGETIRFFCELVLALFWSPSRQFCWALYDVAVLQRSSCQRGHRGPWRRLIWHKHRCGGSKSWALVSGRRLSWSLHCWV